VLALTPPPIRPATLLAPLSPVEAYGADVSRLNGRHPIGPADDAWLALAHALAGAAAVPAAARAATLGAGADGVAALLPEEPAARHALEAAVDGLRAIADRVGADRAGEERGDVGAEVAAVQAVAAQQEQAGAFLLAFSTLAALRAAAAPALDRRAEGLLLAQQGRVARQLGAMAAAAEFYAQSVRAARAARAPEVAARALIGAGSLATVRGNYPEARRLFHQGLAAAARAGADEYRRAAHHGLMVAALSAGDVEGALAHGWSAFRETAPNAPSTRAESLVNLAAVSLAAAEFRASLGACLAALELTDEARVRLPAIGTAAMSAAHLGELRLYESLLPDFERTCARAGASFETARTLAELAEAAVIVGDSARAMEFSERSASLAAKGSFNEITVRLDTVRGNVARLAASYAPPRSDWTTRARHVFHALEQFSTSSRYMGHAVR
jgi:hypothetical protein